VDDDPAAKNDRKNNIGVYAGVYQGGMEEVATFFTHLWVKVIPRNWGWGDYPYPVWVHLKVAGDNTIVYAKILPSSPGAAFSFNESDARFLNISMAHELMPFQDQLTNLYSQLLETAKKDLFTVAVLNTDIFPDDEQGQAAKAKFESCMMGKQYYAGIQIIEASFSKMGDMGINLTADQIFKIHRATPNTQINVILEAITTTISMAERLAVMSQHEMGQTPPREISATQAGFLEKTTDTVYQFISTPLEEGRAAMKRICYESLIACGTNKVELTAANRYPKDVIAAAGFKTKGDPADGDQGIEYQTVMGDKENLIHNFTFNSRDGIYRSVSTQRAAVLTQAFHSLSGLDPSVQRAILSAMGKQKIFEIFNTIFRDVDAGVDLNLQLKPGESDDLMPEDNQQVVGALSQLAQQTHVNVQQTQQNSQQLQQLMQVLKQVFPQIAQALQPQPTAMPMGGAPPGMPMQ
jgi:hypothetical protein